MTEGAKAEGTMTDAKRTEEAGIQAGAAGTEETIRQCVAPQDTGCRLDQYLARTFPEKGSRSHFQALIRDGRVRRIDPTGQTPRAEALLKANERVREGELLEVAFPAPICPKILPEAIPLEILYEDQDLLVVNKPKGMVVHPAQGHYSGTLVNALMAHCKGSLSGINGVTRPGIVHRIDRDTTGALVVCKNDAAHAALARQLQEHSITRAYRAIAAGNFREDTGTVNAPIGRSKTDRKKMAIDRTNGREAVTHYRVLERFGDCTYIECRLETGRTHQIRVHMTSLGHPLLGDTVYGRGKNRFSLQGQTLHAMTLGFVHPRTGEYMEFIAPMPEYFQELLDKLRGV